MTEVVANPSHNFSAISFIIIPRFNLLSVSFAASESFKRRRNQTKKITKQPARLALKCVWKIPRGEFEAHGKSGVTYFAVLLSEQRIEDKNQKTRRQKGTTLLL